MILYLTPVGTYRSYTTRLRFGIEMQTYLPKHPTINHRSIDRCFCIDTLSRRAWTNGIADRYLLPTIDLFTVRCAVRATAINFFANCKLGVRRNFHKRMAKSFFCT